MKDVRALGVTQSKAYVGSTCLTKRMWGEGGTGTLRLTEGGGLGLHGWGGGAGHAERPLGRHAAPALTYLATAGSRPWALKAGSEASLARKRRKKAMLHSYRNETE